jgi:hypothetical protein
LGGRYTKHHSSPKETVRQQARDGNVSSRNLSHSSSQNALNWQRTQEGSGDLLNPERLEIEITNQCLFILQRN